MSGLFDLSNFDKHKEDNCLEVKKAEWDFLYHYWSLILHLQILMAELLLLVLESVRTKADIQQA